MEWKKQIFNKENMDKIKGFKLRRNTHNKNSAERIPGSANNSIDRIPATTDNQYSRANNDSLNNASLDESMESA